MTAASTGFTTIYANAEAMVRGTASVHGMADPPQVSFITRQLVQINGIMVPVEKAYSIAANPGIALPEPNSGMLHLTALGGLLTLRRARRRHVGRRFSAGPDRMREGLTS